MKTYLVKLTDETMYGDKRLIHSFTATCKRRSDAIMLGLVWADNNPIAAVSSIEADEIAA